MRDGVQFRHPVGLTDVRPVRLPPGNPHQAKIVSYESIFASFPPGEALGCCRTSAQNLQSKYYISMILVIPPQCKHKISVHKFRETLYNLFTRLWINTL